MTEPVPPILSARRTLRIGRCLSVAGVVVWALAMALLWSRAWARFLPDWGNGEWKKDASSFHRNLSLAAVGLMVGSSALFSLGTHLARRHLRLVGRQRQGLCVRCGYDLRASPVRCPECGSETPRSAPPEGRNRDAAGG